MMDNARTASLHDADAYLDTSDIPAITIPRHWEQEDEGWREETVASRQAVSVLFGRLPERAVEL